jgi:hypothetical protein
MTNHSRVVLFTGPAAAGKSTVAEAWATSRATPTAFFDHDQARFLVRAGYMSRTAAHALGTTSASARSAHLHQVERGLRCAPQRGVLS